jgi:hypothetical protein
MLVPFSPPDILVDTSPLEPQSLSDVDLSPDSLFDEPQELSSTTTSSSKPPPAPGTRTEATEDYDDPTCTIIARRSAPPIPGLFFDPSLLLPADLANSVLNACTTSFFPPPRDGSLSQVNQVMLFGRAGHEATAFPPFISVLLQATAVLLEALPADTHALLFPGSGASAVPLDETRARARQAIVNLYRPGEGIAPHVDLLSRFGDGIIGVSLGGGVAMRFARVGAGEGEPGYEVWLPPRSVIVLTGEARYAWTHGIVPRTRDRVEEVDGGGDGGWRWHYREPRVSVTFRWLLPGAEIVGGAESETDEDGEDRRMAMAHGNEEGSD